MTLRALLAYVGEDEAGMASSAGQLLVHAAQRIAGVVVVELGDRADGLPTRAGMAILARHRDGAVRIGDLGARRSRSRAGAIGRLLPGHSHQQGNQPEPACNRPAKSSYTVRHVLEPRVQWCIHKNSYRRP